MSVLFNGTQDIGCRFSTEDTMRESNYNLVSRQGGSSAFWLVMSSLLVAILDGLAAVISTYVQLGLGPDRVFQYIASGLMGRSAFSAGLAGAGLGILLHWMIALFWSWLFFRLYPKEGAGLTQKMVAGVIIGLSVYLLMKFVVVPLSLVSTASYSVQLSQVLIHVFLVGMPISFFAARYRQSQRTGKAHEEKIRNV